MSSREFTAHFQSSVAALMGQFVQQKRACGYKYGEAARVLARFDRFLCDEALSGCELPRSLSRKWLAKQRHESPLPKIPSWKQNKTLLEWLHSL